MEPAGTATRPALGSPDAGPAGRAVTAPPGRTGRAPLLPLAAVAVLTGVSSGLTSPFLAFFLDRYLHASPLQTTAFLVVSPVSAIVVSSALGRLSDRGGRRRPLLLVISLCGALGYGCFALCDRYWFLLAVSGTVLAVGGTLFPQIFAYARAAVPGGAPGQAPLAVNTLRTLFSATWVVIPPVAGLLLARVGFRGLYAAGGVSLAVAAVVIALWLHEPRAGAAREAAAGRRPRPGLRATIPRPRAAAGPPSVAAAPSVATSAAPSAVLWTGVVAFTCLQCANSLSVLALPPFFSQDLGVDVGQAGLVLGLCAGLEIPLMLATGMLASRMPLERMIKLGCLAGAAYYALVLASARPWQVAAGQVLNASFVAVVQGVGISWFQNLMPASPGRATAAYANTNRLAALATAPIIGACQQFGYRLAFGSCLSLALTGLAVLALAGRLPRRPQA